MRDLRINIAAGLSGFCAIGFAAVSLCLPISSKLAVPDDPSAHPQRVVISLMQGFEQFLNAEGFLMLLAALMLICGIMVMTRTSAVMLRRMRNISLCSLLYLLLEWASLIVWNVLPPVYNGGFFKRPESQHMPFYDNQPEIGFRLAMVFAAAALLISVYGRARAKKLLNQQTAAETTVTETNDAEGESSC